MKKKPKKRSIRKRPKTKDQKKDQLEITAHRVVQKKVHGEYTPKPQVHWERCLVAQAALGFASCWPPYLAKRTVAQQPIAAPQMLPTTGLPIMAGQ